MRPLRVAVSTTSLVSLLSLFCAACGSGAPMPAESAMPPELVAHPPSKPRAPVTSLGRSGVREVVRGGMGRFLQDVSLEDTPVMRNGKFLGFRVVALFGPLEDSELRPGDVVTRVNGKPIEHPEEALVVFQSLTTATELVVDYERGGKAQQLKLPIVDDAAPAPPGK